MSRGRVGRYEIVRPVGRGGMATVYLARQIELDRQVALKELSAFHESDPGIAQRFLRESRLAGSLSHPNIVTVHDYFEHRGTPYIAMEYMPRGPLRPYVGRLPIPEIGGVLDGMLAALTHAEQHGIVHRDLKPENVMVSEDGGVKIVDFGIAKASNLIQVGGSLTSTGTTLGTPSYMAPEQAMAAEVGPWTDLYSLGVMAFELISGRRPFDETESAVAILMHHVNDSIPPLASIVPQLSPKLSDWVARLVVKQPAQRTRSAVAAGDELDEIMIEMVGPRWRRESRLHVQPGMTAPTEAVAAASLDRLPATASRRRVGAGAAGAAAFATSPPARRRTPRAREPTRVARMAATMPPTPRAEDSPPPARGQRSRRRRLGGLWLALGLTAAVAVFAVAFMRGSAETPSGQRSASQPPTTDAVMPVDQPTTEPQTADAAPSPEYASTLTRVLGELQHTARPYSSRLVTATDPGSRNEAARALGAAYDNAARQLGGLRLSPADAAANVRLVAALDRTAAAYHRSARAGADERRRRAATRQVRAGERSIDGAIGELRSIGYGTEVQGGAQTQTPSAADPAQRGSVSEGGASQPAAESPQPAPQEAPSQQEAPAPQAPPSAGSGDSQSDDPSDDAEGGSDGA